VGGRWKRRKRKNRKNRKRRRRREPNETLVIRAFPTSPPFPLRRLTL
jgi:hypothetical protein